MSIDVGPIKFVKYRKPHIGQVSADDNVNKGQLCNARIEVISLLESNNTQ